MPTHGRVALNGATYVLLNATPAEGLVTVLPQTVDIMLSIGTTTTVPTDDALAHRLPSSYNGGGLRETTLALTYPGLAGAAYLFAKIAKSAGQGGTPTGTPTTSADVFVSIA